MDLMEADLQDRVDGGASDVRLVPGNWNDPEGLCSRIIVAGGGGASGNENDHNAPENGYAGGGVKGQGTSPGGQTPNSLGAGHGEFGIGANSVVLSYVFITTEYVSTGARRWWILWRRFWKKLS